MDFSNFNNLLFYQSVSIAYITSVIPLALLGVYGIARSVSELLGLLASRIGNIVIFPFIASHSQIPRADLRELVVTIRLKFLIVAALGFSFSAATVDLAIKLVFDQRYHAAGWMAPILINGAWISILCSMGKSALLGLGKPRYGAIGNTIKFGWLLVGLPIGFNRYGPVGAMMAIAASDIFRYMSVFIGQSTRTLFIP